MRKAQESAPGRWGLTIINVYLPEKYRKLREFTDKALQKIKDMKRGGSRYPQRLTRRECQHPKLLRKKQQIPVLPPWKWLPGN